MTLIDFQRAVVVVVFTLASASIGYLGYIVLRLWLGGSV